MRKPLSNHALKQRLHDHGRLCACTEASRISRGEIDVQLLRDAGLHVDKELLKNPQVKLEFDSIQLNVNQGRGDPLFRAYDQTGQFTGHYFASAFKSLTT